MKSSALKLNIVGKAREFADDTKEFCNGGKEYTAQFFKDFRVRVKQINTAELFVQLLAVLVICIAFALFCHLREGTGDMYMSVFIPLFIANSIIVFFTSIYKSSRLYSTITTLLITAGAALQIFMLPANEESLSDVYKFVIFIFAGIVIGLIALPFLTFLTSEKLNTRSIRLCVAVLTVFAYLILLIFGREVNGARAWIFVGGLSIQVTEFTKLLAILFFAICLADKSLENKRKNILTLLMLFVHIGFLALCNEFGTLLVIAVVYFVEKFIFMENKKAIFIELAVLIAAAAVLLSSLYGICKIVLPQDDETVSVTEAVDENIEDEADESENAAPDFVVEILTQIYSKISRIGVYLGLEDTTGNSYQIDKAFEYLLVADWLGVEKASLASLPLYDSDFVFIYLIVRLGILGMLVILCSLCAMLMEVYVHSARSDRHTEARLAITFVTLIVFQAAICACSNIGLLPVVGLAFPYLSSGGSSLAINLIMSFYILYFMRKTTKSEVKS